jgi:dolichol-phosphate mannosyltransferase
MKLSVAVPVFNEADNVTELVSRILKVLDGIPGGPHELIITDDGSSDGTRAALQVAVTSDPRIRALLLSRNFGHQQAITAALDHVTGDLVVVMDGDLQDTPEAIPQLLEMHDRGFDVVYAERVDRQEGWLLRISYRLFYRIMARLSGVPIPLDAGDFALMSRRVVEAIRSAPERNRYLRGLRAWAGFRQVGLPIARGKRLAGTTKYSFSALIKLAFNGIFAFSTVPIRAALLLGAFAVAAAVLFTAYAVTVKLTAGRTPAGFTSLVVTITFLSGVNLFFLGVIGEYVGRIYEETKQRPLYIIEQVLRHQSQPDSNPVPTKA